MADPDPYEWPEHINGGSAHNPHLMSGYNNSNWVYGNHVKHDGHAFAYRFNWLTGEYDYSPRYADLNTDWMDQPTVDLQDWHYGYSVGVGKNLGSDVLFVAGNHHDDVSPVTTHHVIRCDEVEEMDNPDSWVLDPDDHFDSLDADPFPQTYTYHNFERLSDGTLLHFFSQSEQGLGSEGRDQLAFKYLDGTWSPLFGDGHFAVTFDTGPSDADRVYIVTVHVEIDYPTAGVDTVHISGIFRTDDADATSAQNPFYAYARSTDLTTWFNADGTSRTVANGGLPFSWANRAAATVTTGFSHSSRHGIYIAPNTHRPSVIWRDAGTADFYRWTWDGSAWGSTLLAAGGGECKEFEWRAGRWRQQLSANRLLYTNVFTGKTTRCGGQVATGGVPGYTASHDPILLRERDTLAVALGRGDTPLVWLLGNHKRKA